MKQEKGMTLLELLIAMGISAMIMAATFIIIQFSAATYDNTLGMIKDNNNTYDASNILNQYIRTSSYIALDDNDTGIFITVDDSTFGGSTGDKHTIRIAYDVDDKTLFIDRLDGSNKMIISREISRIEWEILHNGVKYTAYELTATGNEQVRFSGYACKRGR